MKRKIKSRRKQTPWNKGRKVGRKLPLRPQQVRSIRNRLKSAQEMRNLALFNLAIDSSLGATDIVQLRVRDIARAGRVLSLGTTTRVSTQRPIQFEITGEARRSAAAWIAHKKLKPGEHLFPTRLHGPTHVSIRQYAKLAAAWVRSIGLNPRAYGTESLRRTKPALIYQQTRSLLAAQLHLGHTRQNITARYLGIEFWR